MSTSKYYRFPMPESHDKKIQAILARQKKKDVDEQKRAKNVGQEQDEGSCTETTGSDAEVSNKE